MMLQQDISKYVFNTLNNTNPNILTQFLNDYAATIKEFYENQNVTKIAPYLYSINYNNWDYSNIDKIQHPFIGKCSSVRKGNLFGRNYDWYYDNHVTFVLKCNQSQGKYASLGVAGSMQYLTENYANLMSYDELYQLLPFLTNDGINEKGVICNINVTATGDMGFTTGTNPKKKSLPGTAIVRLILDYAATAKQGVELLQQYNIINSLYGQPQEFHWMIADANETYVVEVIYNKINVIDHFVNDKPIMTNFYLTNFNGTKASLTPYGMGLERYNILSSLYDDIEDEDDMISAMQMVNYTQTYKSTTNPFWYSEYYGDYTKKGFGNLTKDSPLDDFIPVVEKEIEEFENRQRDGKTWQTVHSSVYNITNKSLALVVEEENTTYNFTLN